MDRFLGCWTKRQAPKTVTSLIRFFYGAGLGMLAAVLMTGAPLASDWSTIKVSGAALILKNNQWEVLTAGVDVPPEHAVRTLETGKIELSIGDALLVMAPNTAVMLAPNAIGDATIKQYSGALLMSAPAGDRGRYVVETPDLSTEVSRASAVFAVADGMTSIKVSRGKVIATYAKTGLQVELNSGDVLDYSAANAAAVPDATVGDEGSDGEDAAGEVSDGSVPESAATNEPKASTNNAGGNSSDVANENSNAGGSSATAAGSGNSNAGGAGSSSNAGGNSSNSNAGGNSSGAGNSGNSKAGGKSKNKN